MIIWKMIWSTKMLWHWDEGYPIMNFIFPTLFWALIVALIPKRDFYGGKNRSWRSIRIRVQQNNDYKKYGYTWWQTFSKSCLRCSIRVCASINSVFPKYQDSKLNWLLVSDRVVFHGDSTVSNISCICQICCIAIWLFWTDSYSFRIFFHSTDDYESPWLIEWDHRHSSNSRPFSRCPYITGLTKKHPCY